MEKYREIIETFNELYPTWNNLSDLQKKLGESIEEVKQNTLLNIIKYSDKYEISEKEKNGFYFICFKRECLKELQKKGQSEFEKNITKIEDGYYDDNWNQYCEKNEEISNDYIEKIKQYVTEEEYQLLLDYYDKNIKIDDKSEVFKLINKIKKNIGYKGQYFLLIDEEGKKYKFDKQSDLAKYIGINYTYLSSKLKGSKITLKYKDRIFSIKKITKFDFS